MKKIILSASLICFLLLAGALAINAGNKTLSEGFNHNEGTTVYKDKLFVSNFGTDNPLNNENKGYILSFNKNMKSEILIKEGSGLSAPKGMTVLDNRLYIADVGRVMIFNLDDLELTPVTLRLSSENMFVNDVVAVNDEVWFSASDSGNIFKYK